jgi:hypothetical protein
MLRHAVAIFFWASAVFVFILSLRAELLDERAKKNRTHLGKH